MPSRKPRIINNAHHPSVTPLTSLSRWSVLLDAPSLLVEPRVTVAPCSFAHRESSHALGRNASRRVRCHSASSGIGGSSFASYSGGKGFSRGCGWAAA